MKELTDMIMDTIIKEHGYTFSDGIVVKLGEITEKMNDKNDKYILSAMVDAIYQEGFTDGFANGMRFKDEMNKL